MGFVGNTLWRAGEDRTDATLDEALRHRGARVFLRHRDGWLARGGDGLDFGPDEAEALGGAEPVLLGYAGGGGAPRLVLSVEATPPAETGIALHGLRALASAGQLDPDLEGQLGQAEHLLNWHRRTRFCGICGGSTVAEAAGYRRRCARCGEAHFPRTDPVSIMLVHDRAGRCLLGRSPHFAPGMWSCLAGFIEPGETLEAAVRRETQEEAGIAVGDVRYYASQPWPFPGSLMIGCLAEATTTDIVFNGVELEDCRWFDREELGAMLAGRHGGALSLPQPFAIAHHLIRAFADAAA